MAQPARRAVPACCRALIAAAALAAAGCHMPLAVTSPGDELRASGRYDLVDGLDVPEVDGVEGCGAQALAAALALVGPGDAVSIAAGLPWHDFGATPVDLLLAARDRGLKASISRGSWEDLQDAARRDRPALVMINAGVEVRTLTGRIPSSPLMHWAIVSGMAHDGSRVLLGAPGDRHHVVRRESFLRRWSASDCCLITVGGEISRRAAEPQRSSGREISDFRFQSVQNPASHRGSEPF